MIASHIDPEPVFGGPQANLERMLIEEYLRQHCLSLRSLSRLPVLRRRKWMAQACLYASLHLAEIEQRAHFVNEIREAGQGL